MHPFWQMCHFPGLSLKSKSITKSKETCGREELFHQALPHWFYPHLNKQAFESSVDFIPPLVSAAHCSGGSQLSFQHCSQPFGKMQPDLAEVLEGHCVQPPHSWFPVQHSHTEVLQGFLPWLPQLMAQGTILKPPIKCLFCIWDPSVLTR